ncbi:MAG: hypothetical protein MHM6MM_000337 [Cercozoa sp. M6MM]
MSGDGSVAKIVKRKVVRRKRPRVSQAAKITVSDVGSNPSSAVVIKPAPSMEPKAKRIRLTDFLSTRRKKLHEQHMRALPLPSFALCACVSLQQRPTVASPKAADASGSTEKEKSQSADQASEPSENLESPSLSLQSFECEEPDERPQGIASVLDVSPKGSRVLTSIGTEVLVHRATDGFVLCRLSFDDAFDESMHSSARVVLAAVFVSEQSLAVACGHGVILLVSLTSHTVTDCLLGHSACVTSLSKCPGKQLLLSTSRDGTMRLWQLRQPKCVAWAAVSPWAAASFDPSGTCIGVASDRQLRLLAVDDFVHNRGSFACHTLCLPPDRAFYTHLEFSSPHRLLVCTRSADIVVYDSTRQRDVLLRNGDVMLAECDAPVAFAPEYYVPYVDTTQFESNNEFDVNADEAVEEAIARARVNATQSAKDNGTNLLPKEMFEKLQKPQQVLVGEARPLPSPSMLSRPLTATWSPDGRYVVTASMSSSISLFAVTSDLDVVRLADWFVPRTASTLDKDNQRHTPKLDLPCSFLWSHHRMQLFAATSHHLLVFNCPVDLMKAIKTVVSAGTSQEARVRAMQRLVKRQIGHDDQLRHIAGGLDFCDKDCLMFRRVESVTDVFGQSEGTNVNLLDEGLFLQTDSALPVSGSGQFVKVVEEHSLAEPTELHKTSASSTAPDGVSLSASLASTRGVPRPPPAYSPVGTAVDPNDSDHVVSLL